MVSQLCELIKKNFRLKLRRYFQLAFFTSIFFIILAIVLILKDQEK